MWETPVGSMPWIKVSRERGADICVGAVPTQLKGAEQCYGGPLHARHLIHDDIEDSHTTIHKFEKVGNAGDCFVTAAAASYLLSLRLGQVAIECVRCFSSSTVIGAMQTLCSTRDGAPPRIPPFVWAFSVPLSPCASLVSLDTIQKTWGKGVRAWKSLPPSDRLMGALTSLLLESVKNCGVAPPAGGAPLGVQDESLVVFCALTSPMGLIYATDGFHTLRHGEKLAVLLLLCGPTNLQQGHESFGEVGWTVREVPFQLESRGVGSLLLIHLDHGVVFSVAVLKSSPVKNPTSLLHLLSAELMRLLHLSVKMEAKLEIADDAKTPLCGGEAATDGDQTNKENHVKEENDARAGLAIRSAVKELVEKETHWLSTDLSGMIVASFSRLPHQAQPSGPIVLGRAAPQARGSSNAVVSFIVGGGFHRECSAGVQSCEGAFGVMAQSYHGIRTCELEAADLPVFAASSSESALSPDSCEKLTLMPSDDGDHPSSTYFTFLSIHRHSASPKTHSKPTDESRDSRSKESAEATGMLASTSSQLALLCYSTVPASSETSVTSAEKAMKSLHDMPTLVAVTEEDKARAKEGKLLLTEYSRRTLARFITVES